MKSLAMAVAAITLSFAATSTFAATDQKTKTTSVKSPESIECSKQADAKGLHGKERKTFRAECKKELTAKASTAPAASPPTTAATTTEAPPATTKN